ncbi:hypothetical protein [Miniphocaeibacter massiliensis]|uniref:hypothetical protein n=1 Tax=Miniphocaeibacter massiliensis TaxID=2041841 RepID=UPI000C1B7D58|nr:hypothetical protein [Miniphocaeibacter massiliensis]
MKLRFFLKVIYILIFFFLIDVVREFLHDTIENSAVRFLLDTTFLAVGFFSIDIIFKDKKDNNET